MEKEKKVQEAIAGKNLPFLTVKLTVKPDGKLAVEIGNNEADPMTVHVKAVHGYIKQALDTILDILPVSLSYMNIPETVVEEGKAYIDGDTVNVLFTSEITDDDVGRVRAILRSFIITITTMITVAATVHQTASSLTRAVLMNIVEDMENIMKNSKTSKEDNA